MITDPVLNSEPFNSLFPFNEKAYDSFYKLKDINYEIIGVNRRNNEIIK